MQNSTQEKTYGNDIVAPSEYLESKAKSSQKEPYFDIGHYFIGSRDMFDIERLGVQPHDRG